MRDDIYWLWLTTTKGLTYRTQRVLVEHFGSARKAYECNNYSGIKGITISAMNLLKKKSLDEAEKIMMETEQIGAYIINYEDEEYPPLLRETSKPPYVIYAKGKHLIWKDMLSIAVVGTRTSNGYGIHATDYIAGSLAAAGAVIVSGMARGIDAEAANAAINNNGTTVAILGSGIDVIYPREHKELFERICENGVVMTEFPPGTRPLRENFPRRNRIIAGLASGVLVVQAPENSGALITAGLALDYNRDVFAVPADIFDLSNTGGNKLIQAGAKLVLNAEDILSEYPAFVPAVMTDVKQTQSSVSNEDNNIKHDDLNEIENNILSVLSKGSLHIDEITRILGISASEMNVTMLMLEMKSLVRNAGGNVFELRRGN